MTARLLAVVVVIAGLPGTAVAAAPGAAVGARTAPPLFLSPAPLPAYPSPPPTRAARPLSPAVVLERYARALRTLRMPRAETFDYTVEQTGPHDLVQTHRIFRLGESERDETTALDGYVLKRPPIRVLERSRDRYAVGRLAPQPAAYIFTYLGSAQVDGRTVYTFATRPRKPGAVAVRRVDIDGRSFLPATIEYRTARRGAEGTVTLTFASVGRFWLIAEAVATATLPGGDDARERIRWSGYRFPAAIPRSAFSSAPPETPASARVATPAPPAAGRTPTRSPGLGAPEPGAPPKP